MFEYMTTSQIIAFFCGIVFSVISVATCIIAVKNAEKATFAKTMMTALVAPFIAVTAWMTLSLTFTPAFIDHELIALVVGMILSLVIMGIVIIVAKTLYHKHPEQVEEIEDFEDVVEHEDIDNQLASALLIANGEKEQIEEINNVIDEQEDVKAMEEETLDTGILEEVEDNEEVDEELEKLIAELTRQDNEEQSQTTEDLEKAEETIEEVNEIEEVQEIIAKDVEETEKTTEIEETNIEEVDHSEETETTVETIEEITNSQDETIEEITEDEEKPSIYSVMQEEFDFNEEDSDEEMENNDKEDSDKSENDDDDDLTDDEKEFEKFLEALRKRREFDTDDNDNE